MRIMGIDPGLATVGYAILDYQEGQLTAVDYGSIVTEANLAVSTRLKQIYDACTKLLTDFKPQIVALEKLFFNRNVTTAFAVGQARGVMMLAAEECGIPVVEYTPLEVKMAVTGYGKASKQQTQWMVKALLKLPQIPKPDDVADALAIAICEAHSSRLRRGMER